MTRYEVELTNEQARGFLAYWQSQRGTEYASYQWQAEYALIDAIRANPPRIAQPCWGEKVIASIAHANGTRLKFVTVAPGMVVDEHGYCHRWFDLIDPEPVGGAQ